MKEYNDTRDAIFEELYDIAINNPNVVVLTADTGALKFRDFHENIPGRFFNVGIAEQNAVTVAAGLSKTGKTVYVFGISNFVTLRSFEQLRVDVCGMKSNVKILGMGAGYTYAQDGLTHHMTEDLAAVNSLPNITIWNPSDYSMTANLIHLANNTPGPCYLRFDKGPFKPIYPTNWNFMRGIDAYGTGNKVGIVATGISVKWANEIVDVLKEKNIEAKAVDVYKIKPLNKNLLGGHLKEAEHVYTIEEHNECGGLGTMVADTMMEHRIYKPLTKFAIPNTFRTEVGDREFLRKVNGMDQDTIIDAIIKNVT